jgi:signal transduction histidine kinase
VPNPITIHLVRLPDALRETCAQAARAIYPKAAIRPATDVAAALQDPAGGRELLVFGGVDEQEGGRASQALDAGDLPRWAVVHLGRETSDLFETVPPEDWNVRQLSRIFRSALMQHDLLRENLCLRGDIKTVARRVTHDLRTPIGCILTVCEALKDPTQGGLAASDTLDAIRLSAQELTKLTDQMSLVLKATLEPVPPLVIGMGPILTQVIAELPADLARRGTRLRQPSAWPEAVGVPAWVEFIWAQLIQNALRHGARTGAVQLGWDQYGREIRFWITSPGAIAPALRPRVMRPFHLLHKQASVGLGLSLVDRLVTLQGGRCGYEPAEDGRSLFFFTLPAHGEALPMPAEKIARSARNLATS